MNSQFIHLRSNVSINVVGSLKSQRIDCISDEVFYESVRSIDRGLTFLVRPHHAELGSRSVQSPAALHLPVPFFLSLSLSSPASLLVSPSKARPPSRAAASSSPVAPLSSTAASTPTAAFAFLSLPHRAGLSQRTRTLAWPRLQVSARLRGRRRLRRPRRLGWTRRNGRRRRRDLRESKLSAADGERRRQYEPERRHGRRRDRDILDGDADSVRRRCGVERKWDVVVSADGSSASAETSGGGSGGSVFFISDEMDFHGEVHADGGRVGD